MPGEWMPWNVPMIPDADIVALRASVSNHWSRKSAALIVISWTKTACWCCGRAGECPARSRPAARNGARVEARRIGRHDAQDRLDEARHLDHQVAVFLVGLGVELRPAAQLADGLAVVVDAPQLVGPGDSGTRGRAFGQRREGAVERQDLEAVARQVELADDLGPQEADDVRGDRESIARHDLLGHGGAAEHVPALQDEHAPAGPREIGGTGQPVVAAADDDRVPGFSRAAHAGRSVPDGLRARGLIDSRVV